MNRHYALFCVNAGWGDDKTLFVCRITPRQFQQRFAQPWIDHTLFMLAFTEQREGEHFEVQDVEWTIVNPVDKLNVTANKFPYFTRTSK